MSSTPTDVHRLGVYIGRFAPFHKGHKELLDHAEKENNKVLVLIGSATQSRNLRTPFSAEERWRLIPAANCDFIRDYPYRDDLWVTQVKKKVRQFMTAVGWTERQTIITLYGSRDSEWYIKMFPEWKHINFLGTCPILSASMLRELYFGGTLDGDSVSDLVADMFLKAMTPTTTYKFLKQWQNNAIYTEFWDGLLRLKALESQFGKGPHTATDALVTCNDEVLLVTRGNIPGKGQFALPGGYLDAKTTLLENAKKELREETNIILPDTAKFMGSRVFDHPTRTGRGRIISHTYHFELETKLNAKGGDDADDAFWIKIKDAVKACESFHDDHAHIIEEMTGVRG